MTCNNDVGVNGVVAGDVVVLAHSWAHHQRRRRRRGYGRGSGISFLWVKPRRATLQSVKRTAEQCQVVRTANLPLLLDVNAVAKERVDGHE